jgi:hypothetical protein
MGAAQGEVRYYVDELEQRLAALEGLLGAGPRRSPPGRGDRADRADHEDPVYEDIPHWNYYRGVTRIAGTRVVRGPVQSGRLVPSRDELIAGIAEALLIERALPELLDPDAHAVTVVISRIGATADAAGLFIVMIALAQRSWLDDLACIDAGGAVRRLATDAEGLKYLGLGIAGLAQPAGGARDKGVRIADARDLALTLRGLFVRAALEGDHGTWMIRAAAAEPDVIRVEIRPGARAQPDAVLRAHAAGRAELERVLEHGGALPPNPDALLPVTRTLAYREPLRGGEPYDVEIEDFATGWVDRGLVRDPPSAIRRAWHLAWSRAAGGAGGTGNGSGGTRGTRGGAP